MKRKNNNQRLVTVCDKCLTASCWHGEFMCWESHDAGLVNKTVGELLELGLEHRDNFSAAKVKYVCGSSAPYGYAKQ